MVLLLLYHGLDPQLLYRAYYTLFKDEKDTWDCWRAMSCSVGIERCAFERGRKERFALCQKWKEYRNERRGHKWEGELRHRHLQDFWPTGQKQEDRPGMSLHIYAFVDDLTMNTRVGEKIVLSEAISDVDSILSLIDYVIEVLLPEYTEKNYDLHSITYSVFIPHLYEHTYRVGYWAEAVAIGAGGTAAVSDFESLADDRKIRIDRFSIGQE